MKRFSDFSQKPERLQGEKTKISDIVNKEIVVIAVDIFDSIKEKNKKAMTLQFYFYKEGEDEDVSTKELHIAKTGSEVLIRQIRENQDEIPFLTMILKQNSANGKSYYTFS